MPFACLSLLFLKLNLTKVFSSSENQCLHFTASRDPSSCLLPGTINILIFIILFLSFINLFILPPASCLEQTDFYTLCVINPFQLVISDNTHKPKREDKLYKQNMELVSVAYLNSHLRLHILKDKTHLVFSVCDGDEGDGVDSP